MEQAFAVVKYLLQGHSNDERVVQALKDFLQTPDEEHADIIGLDKCTGMALAAHACATQDLVGLRPDQQ